MKDLFRGQLIRLTSEEPDVLAKQEVRWQRDSEFHRLADSEAADMFSEKKLKERFDNRAEDGLTTDRIRFSIRTLEGDVLIGFLGLWVNALRRDVWVGIGIGERDYWSKGYGTDAMKLALQYAFMELGAHRVTLGLMEYNPRALKSYEKVGFRIEGRSRGDVFREGKHYDSIWMGILYEEWLVLQQGDR